MNSASGRKSQLIRQLPEAIRSKRSRRDSPVIEALEGRQMLSASVANSQTPSPLVVTLGAGSEFDSVSYDNGAGQFFQITLTGPGNATIPLLGAPLTSTVNAKHKTDVVTGSSFVSVDSITITGTTARSALKVSGSLNLNSLTTDSVIGSINGPGVFLQGAAGGVTGGNALVSLTAGGGIGKLVLGPVDYCDVSISGAPAPHGMAISVSEFGNSTLSSTVPISSFTTALDVAEGIAGSTLDLT